MGIAVAAWLDAYQSSIGERMARRKPAPGRARQSPRRDAFTAHLVVVIPAVRTRRTPAAIAYDEHAAVRAVKLSEHVAFCVLGLLLQLAVWNRLAYEQLIDGLTRRGVARVADHALRAKTDA